MKASFAGALDWPEVGASPEHGWFSSIGKRVLLHRLARLVSEIRQHQAARVSKSTKQFTKVAKFVGLGQDRARIERAIGQAGFQSLPSMEKKHCFVEVSDKAARFFRKSTGNEWREALSRDQVIRVVNAHRVQMARFGYVPAGY